MRICDIPFFVSGVCFEAKSMSGPRASVCFVGLLSIMFNTSLSALPLPYISATLFFNTPSLLTKNFSLG